MTLIDKLERTAKYIDYIEERTGDLTIMEEGARDLFREAAKALRDTTPAPATTDQKNVFHKGQLYTVEYLVQDAKDRDRLDKLERHLNELDTLRVLSTGVDCFIMKHNLAPDLRGKTLRELIDAVQS